MFSYFPDSSKQNCVKLFCCGVNIGIVKPQILQDIITFKEVFVAENDVSEIRNIKISENLKTVEDRTLAINGVFKKLQLFPDRYPCLKGWRNEVSLLCTVRSFISQDRFTGWKKTWRKFGLPLSD